MFELQSAVIDRRYRALGNSTQSDGLTWRVIILRLFEEASGKTVWSIQAEPWQEGYTITAAPLYFDGMVIVGFAGGEYGTRGRVKAYDAKDGRLIWTFYPIPGPGEMGHETWPDDNDAWKH